MKLYFPVLLGALVAASQAAVASDLDVKTFYHESRSQFLQLCQEQKGQLRSWSHPTTSELSYDFCLLNKASPFGSKSPLVIISSGLHGIEGLWGARLVIEFLKKPELRVRLGSVGLFHSLNPWGLVHQRRVNEDNVDLNRSFLESRTTLPKNESYNLLNEWLNRQSPSCEHLVCQFFDLWDTFQLVLRWGRPALQQAILLGQYQEPRGIFYGGHQETWLEKNLLNPFLQEIKNSPYTPIVWIDLHTGYGKNRKMHLLKGRFLEEVEWKEYSDVFRLAPLDTPRQREFYTTQGDLISWVDNRLQGAKKVYSLVLEFGTLDSQTFWGAYQSLRRMRQENQFYFFKGDEKTRTNFREMFYPRDPLWQRESQEQFETFLKEIHL